MAAIELTCPPALSILRLHVLMKEGFSLATMQKVEKMSDSACTLYHRYSVILAWG